MRKSWMEAAVVATATATAIMAAGVAHAAIYHDAAAGNWQTAGTWTENAAPTATTDSVYIDQYQVTAAYNLFTGGNVYLQGDGAGPGADGTLYIPYSSGGAAAAQTNLFLAGGSLSASRMTLINTTYINIQGDPTIDATSAGDYVSFGPSSLSASVQLTGNGTLNKTGPGIVQFRSAITNATDNRSTFSGTFSIAEGTLLFGHPQQTKLATVNLSGGTFATNYGADIGSYTRPEVANLKGSGQIQWQDGGSYRDLLVSGTMDPGSASAAGTITRANLSLSGAALSKNDLVFGAGSTLFMDVLSPSSADKIVWKDETGISGIVFNTAALKIRLFTPDGALGPTSWVLIDGDEWISSGGAGAATPVAIQDQAFASVTYLDATGTGPVDLWDGTPSDSGWKDLQISYLGSASSSNRQVVLSGEYVPEPGVGALISVTGMLLGLRRRHA